MIYTLFFVFLAIFLATAVVTLLGITKRVMIEDKYLKPLFVALILEVVGATITLFAATDFFGSTANEFIESLPKEVQAETEAETTLKITRLLNDHNKLINEIQEKESGITELKQELKQYEDIKDHALLLFAQLNIDIARSSGDFINLTFQAEDKNEVAARIHKACTAIGAFGPNVGKDPMAVHDALLSYQKRKDFKNPTGNIGRQTLNRMISDYLENVRRGI